MEKDIGVRISQLKVDGGAARDRFLMQFQSNICKIAIVRPVIRETTALGAACLAGITVGFWKDNDDVISRWQRYAVFEPEMAAADKREKLVAGWHKAVSRSRDWAE